MTKSEKPDSGQPVPIDVQAMAYLLHADSELETIERELKRSRQWHRARRIAGVRILLNKAMAGEHDKLLRAIAALDVKV
jgi:hypothetical protein